MNDRLLTVAEASDEYFVPEKTIRTWLERGRLSWYQPGLLLDSDLATVERQTRKESRWRKILALVDVFEA